MLGAGPGGYSAAFRAADLGLKVVLVERYPTLGGVCLNVGCIPSKALLHVAAVIDEVAHFDKLGVSFGAPTRRSRQAASRTRTRSSAGSPAAWRRWPRCARSRSSPAPAGSPTDHHVSVELAAGGTTTIGFARAIIAAGSEAVKLPFMPKDDPRIVTSTGALELPSEPKRMLIVGGGIIGLEMGTVYSTLGARLDVVEMLDGLMQGADRDLVKVWQKLNAPRFDNILLKTKTVSAEARPDGILVKFEGEGALKEQLYDLVLQAVGRVPNGKRIGAEAGGRERHRARLRPGRHPDAHQRAAHLRGRRHRRPADARAQGGARGARRRRGRGRRAARRRQAGEAAFDARVIPSVAYTDPEIAWVGLTEDEAKARGVKVKKGLFPWTASGRAIANGRDEGFTKLLFDEASHAIVGGGIVGTHAGDMIGEIALAIEMGADAVDIGKTIHPHPTLGESIGLAAEAFEGTCTDLPPARR